MKEDWRDIMESIHDIERQIAELQKRKAEIENGRSKAIDDLTSAIVVLRKLGLTDADICTIGNIKRAAGRTTIAPELTELYKDQSQMTKVEKIFIPYKPKAPVKKPRRPAGMASKEEIKCLTDSMRERDKTIKELAKEKVHGTYHHVWWLLNRGALKDKVKRTITGAYHLQHGQRPRGNKEELHRIKEAADLEVLNLLDKPKLAKELYPLVQMCPDALRSRLSHLTREGKIVQIKEDSAHKTKYIRAGVVNQEAWKKHVEGNKVQPPAPGEDGKTWRRNQIKRILANGSVWASNTMIDTLAESSLGFAIAKKAVQYKVSQLTSDFYFRQKRNVGEARLPSMLTERFGGYDAAFRDIEAFVFNSKDKGEITVSDWDKFLYLGQEKALMTWDWFVFYAAKVLQLQDLGTGIQIIKDRIIWKPLVWKEFEEVRA